MKKISRWAQRHLIAARLIITISHFLIIANGLLFGLLLFLNDWQHASYTVYFLILGFTLLHFFYPKRGQKTGPFKYSYRAQKTHDFGLVLLSFLMVSVGSNNWLTQNIGTEMIASPTATFIVHKQKKLSKRQFKKQLRKELRALKKGFKKSKNQKGGLLVIRILLSMLVLGLAAFLVLQIATLSCNLSCAGSSGLAILTVIGGFIGVAILLILAYRMIWSKKINNKKAKNKRKIFGYLKQQKLENN